MRPNKAIRDSRIGSHLPRNVRRQPAQRNIPRTVRNISLCRLTLLAMTELNTLALLAHALDPCAVQGPSPGTPASVPPGRMAEALFNIPTGASGSSNPARQSIDDGQQSGSHGTLMLGKRGRSKYLGPTAGSEWLKEASRLSGLKKHATS